MSPALSHAETTDTSGSSGSSGVAIAASETAAARVEMEATVVQMKSVARRVRDVLRDARKRGTSHQIACVDEALSRSDVALRNARGQSEDSLGAYARGDLDGARVARARVLELREHQRVAARDGDACWPPRVAVVIPPGRRTVTTVRMTVDPSLRGLPSLPD